MRLMFAAALLACSLSLPSGAWAERPFAFVGSVPAQGAALVLPMQSKGDVARLAQAVDAPTLAAVDRALTADKFEFTEGSTLVLRGIGPWSRVVVIGAGTAPATSKTLQDIGGIAAQQTNDVDGPVTVIANHLPAVNRATAASDIAVGARLGGYSFDKYKYADPAKPKPAGQNAPMNIVAAPGSEAAFASSGRALVDGVLFSRDLIREPANVIFPQSFVERTRAAFRGVPNVTIEVFDEAQMQRSGMGSILSVGKGSARPPRMLLVRYRGASGAPLVALAGKGITFDSGGISLKPGNGMWAMKGDMAGAAGVVGTVLSLAKSRAPVDVVAIAALAENMPGGSATRPGDVVRAYNGKSIEILNTDAEGRLVLADAVSYAERNLRPAVIVDVATLTGAVSTALGDEYAGLFTRNDALAAQLTAAGAATGEELWRLPLHPNYAKDMKSDIADIKNVVEGGAPGAGFGAHFIGYFVETTPWAHLDIAGVDSRGSSLPTVPEGLSGFGVRLLDRFVRDYRPVAAPSATMDK
ncbi:leucyl aminopeptidase [Sphingomonas lutea]|uniref:Probable cytosol aminopeptidase n=1 Tax=Sphingomonas lutea TaxID=1045317 RepID=A0A7G9SK48_9SPHN|nr:leucyl aminopeptidase [Sphingomonas lutea]QNN68223.1 leucyl aminopeptidase [Sphingomonas lutea]